MICKHCGKKIKNCYKTQKYHQECVKKKKNEYMKEYFKRPEVKKKRNKYQRKRYKEQKKYIKYTKKQILKAFPFLEYDSYKGGWEILESEIKGGC